MCASVDLGRRASYICLRGFPEFCFKKNICRVGASYKVGAHYGNPGSGYLFYKCLTCDVVMLHVYRMTRWAVLIILIVRSALSYSSHSSDSSTSPATKKIYILRLYFVAFRVTLLAKIWGSPTKLDAKDVFTQVGIQSTLSDFQPTGSDEPPKGLFTPWYLMVFLTTLGSWDYVVLLKENRQWLFCTQSQKVEIRIESWK